MSETKKKVLTPEVRKALLGLNPFNPESTISFTPAFYEIVDKNKKILIPEEFRPVFQIRPYNKNELTSIRKFYTGLNAEDADLDEIKDFARIVIRDWENLYDAGTMEEITYSEEEDHTSSKDVVYSFSFQLINAIITRATKISGLQIEETEALK